jgi:hypothetical protein
MKEIISAVEFFLARVFNLPGHPDSAGERMNHI